MFVHLDIQQQFSWVVDKLSLAAGLQGDPRVAEPVTEVETPAKTLRRQDDTFRGYQFSLTRQMSELALGLRGTGYEASA